MIPEHEFDTPVSYENLHKLGFHDGFRPA